MQHYLSVQLDLSYRMISASSNTSSLLIASPPSLKSLLILHVVKVSLYSSFSYLYFTFQSDKYSSIC